jgi:hypothetical protein
MLLSILITLLRATLTYDTTQIRLLRRGVARAHKHRGEGAYIRSRSSKLPWKHIAEYIEEHGGSYSFAPATCAKKWDEVIGR